MTRMQMARRRNQPLGLPALPGGDYLVEALIRLGPTRSDGMGERPVDWPEIEAFARLTGRIGEPWEAELIFDMAGAYLPAREAGKDSLAQAPVEQDQAADR